MSKVYTIFGGQMGSEGKGEIAALITKNVLGVVAGVRIGGPNAGHTCYDHDGRKVVVQSLPTPSAINGCDAFIGPEGCFIPGLLVKEIIDFFERNPGAMLTLHIDPNAAIITEEHMQREASLKGKIGSTGEGVGAVTSDKVMRLPITVANHVDLLPWMRTEVRAKLNDKEIEGVFVVDNRPTSEINQALAEGQFVNPNMGRMWTNPKFIIEGTQGYGLSLHTGGFYPFCTSRECTPYALWAGTGINPKLGDSEVIMVVRTFPIRVGGNSGPLENEITWETLQEETNGYVSVPEMTTVTKKVRRIARIDHKLLRRAVLQTTPDYIALTFLDYVFPKIAGRTWADMEKSEECSEVIKYVLELETTLGVPVGIISTGPGCASFTNRYRI